MELGVGTRRTIKVLILNLSFSILFLSGCVTIPVDVADSMQTLHDGLQLMTEDYMILVKTIHFGDEYLKRKDQSELLWKLSTELNTWIQEHKKSDE